MNAVRKQIESSSQVVQKSFGNASYFCRTQLLLICKPKRFGGLLCYWQSLHILHSLCACTQMFVSRKISCVIHRLQQGRFKQFTVVGQFERNRHGLVGCWANDIFK